MSENNSLSLPKPVSYHLQDLYSIIRSTVILVAFCAIFWSFTSASILTEWILSFNFGDDSQNMAIYSPFEWIEIKWSFSILMSMISVIPVTSYLLLRFAKPGLYPQEYSWLRFVFLINSLLLPVLIFIIWFWIMPEMVNAVSSISELNNVSPRYDIAEISRLSLGITWIAIVSLILINSLTIARSTNSQIGIYSWIRPRLIIMCAGILILTIPATFDGLRIVISISIIILCDNLSRIVPLTNNDA